MKRTMIISLALLLALSGGLIYFLQRPETSNTLPSSPLANESANQAIESTNEVSEKTDISEDELDYLNDQILSGGPPKDGIPPIDEPKYLSVNEIDFLEEYDKVFVYESDSEVFLYPQRILVWHEIVNDQVDGENFSITYCPLTGSTICYLGDINRPNNTYGTSGNLLNSNLVMYDRDTDSYIPQILGIGINKSLKNTILPTRPVHWTNWEYAKELYPDAKVLSLETGYFRDYNSDPYGSYAPGDDTYYSRGGPIFPVLNAKGIFLDKKVVVGVKSGEKTLAIDPSVIEEKKILAFEIGDDKAIAIYDEDIKAVRIFNRHYEGQLLDFTVSDGGFMDSAGRLWRYNGQSDDLQLDTLTYFDVMWFAWYAYYPDTEVIQ